MKPVIKCRTGKYTGTVENETNVFSFKGISYAQAPVGKLRWKPPVPLKPSSDTFDASHFGKLCPQTNDIPEEMLSENCLKLNIWTKDLDCSGKTVMVFFHGGSYAGGGTVLPEYSGQYLAAAFSNLIVVTCHYRLNLLGFIDFSGVPGGSEYKESGYLGLLDCQEALRWIQNNIENFGGDPSNVTIFGESAGGGIVSLLMTAESSKGLFRRVIAQSGSCGLSFTIDKFRKNSQAEMLLDISGCTCMNELVSKSVHELLRAMYTETGKKGPEGGSTLADLNNFPLVGSGSIFPSDWYSALKNGWAKDVDLIIGTTEDEFRMWIPEQKKDTDEENTESYYYFIKEKYEDLLRRSPENRRIRIRKALNLTRTEKDKPSEYFPGIWKYTFIENEEFFRCPALKMAEAHCLSKGKGRTYMYLWGKHADIFPYLHACHACELPYVFLHLHENILCGNTDPKLALMTSAAWVHFAETGSPDTEYASWNEYDLNCRSTMYFSNSSEMYMVKDPYSVHRKLLRDICEC